MIIQPIEEQHVSEIAALEQQVWGEAAAVSDQIAARARAYSNGSLLAQMPSGKIVGYAVGQRVDHISTGSWATQTDNGRIERTHRQDGPLLYGVNLSVLPEGARHGVSSALIDHCYRTFVQRGPCVGICLGSRVPGFARWAQNNGADIRRYLACRSSGLSRDPELRIYERNGFRVLWELNEYFVDPESRNYGAMILRNRQ